MDMIKATYAYCQAVIRSRISNERGAALVEYALLLALIAVVCIAAITLIGNNAKTKFSQTGSSLG